MNISVPSRFACLRVEDDDGASRNNSKKRNDKLPKKSTTSASAKKNGGSTNNKSNKKNQNKVTDQQWEEWKKKDSELVNDNFEQDLQDAILLSKLEFETNKVVDNKSDKTNGNKKKKSKTTMYLDEFLEGSDKKATTDYTQGEESKDKNGDDHFFQKILAQTKKEVTKGKVEEERKQREQNIDEHIISIAQCQEKLKLERERNAELQQQLKDTKAEIVTIKARNKMLCNILGHGEMRDKAEILLELERLNNIKDELTEEVGHLHKLLEQERSKSTVSDPQTVKHKDNKNKN